MKFSTFEEKMFTKRIWKKIVKGLSCLVVFCTVYALILPAITIEANAYCGQQEHKHTWSCYRREQICTKREHTHSQECFDDQGNLICSIEEHTHHSDCYEQVLDCAMTEHTHSLRCFSNPKADLEDEKDWKVPDPEDGQTKRERIVQTAKSQIGQKESSDNYLVQDETIKKGISRYGQWDGDDYEDWSGAFVRFVLEKSQADSTTKQAPKSVLDWMKELFEQEDLQVVSDAASGDVLFVYDENDKEGPKAGIVTTIDEETITAIMGDWNNEVKQERFAKEDDRLHSILKPVEDEFESQDNLNNNNAQTGSNENQTNGSEWMDENNPDNPNKYDQDQPNQSDRQSDQSNQSDQPSSNPDSSTSSDWTEEDEKKTSEDRQTETDKENNQKGQEGSQLNNQENKTSNNPNYNTNKTNRSEESYSDSKNSSDKSADNSQKNGSSSISITGKADSNLPVPKPVKKEDTNKKETNNQEDKNKATDQTSETQDGTDPDKQDTHSSQTTDGNADPDKDSDQTKDGKEDSAHQQKLSDWDFTKEVTAKDGAVIRVSWNKGTFETDDVVFQAKTVELSQKEQKKLEEQLDKDKKYQFRNYDLTFYVRNDQFELEKVEPTKPVQVEIIQKDYKNDQDSSVFHFKEDKTLEQIELQQKKTENNETADYTTLFMASSFSVYTQAFEDNGVFSSQASGTVIKSVWNFNEDYDSGKRSFYLNGNVDRDNGTDDKNINLNLDNGGEVIIDLNGHVWQISGTIKISNKTKLIITNSSKTTTQSYTLNSSWDKSGPAGTSRIQYADKEGNMQKAVGGGLIVSDGPTIKVEGEGSSVILENGVGIISNGHEGIIGNNAAEITLNHSYICSCTTGVGVHFGSKLTINEGAVVSLNTNTDGRGGGVYADDLNYGTEGGVNNDWYGSQVTMNGGLISSNTAQTGGGVCIGRVKAFEGTTGPTTQDDFARSCLFTMNGGTIAGNTSTMFEGGGLALQYQSYSRAVIYNGEFYKNHATSGKDWGGGGIFVSEYNYLWMPNGASIYDNHADGLGGGLTGCATGKLIVDSSLRVFQNTAEGNDSAFPDVTDKPKSYNYIKGRDKVSGFEGYYGTAAGYKGEDIFGALITQVSGKFSTKDGLINANWQGNVDKSFTVDNDGTTLNASDWLTVKCMLPNNETDLLKNVGLQIHGNDSKNHGGGVLINGWLVTGNSQVNYLGKSFELDGYKKLIDDTNTSITMTANQFHFKITECNDPNAPAIITGANNEAGKIIFNGKLPVGDQEKESYTFYLMEDLADMPSGYTGSKDVYQIDVTVQEKERTSFWMQQWNENKQAYKAVEVVIITREMSTIQYKKLPDGQANTINFPANPKVTIGSEENPTFTNKVTEKTSVRVKKKWSNGNENHSSQNVTVYLLRNGETQDTQTLSPSNGWTHTWTNLPVSEGEQSYTYTVSEEVPTGYLSTIELTEIFEGQPGTDIQAYTPAKEIVNHKTYLIIDSTNKKGMSRSGNTIRSVDVNSYKVDGLNAYRSDITQSGISQLTVNTEYGMHSIDSNEVKINALKFDADDNVERYLASSSDSPGLRILDHSTWGAHYYDSGDQGFCIDSTDLSLQTDVKKVDSTHDKLVSDGSQFGTKSKLPNVAGKVQLFELGTVNTGGISGGVEYTITNTPISNTLTITKTDSTDENKTLAGAKFTLYSDETCKTSVPVTGSDGSYQYAVDGSNYEMTTGSNGQFTLSQLPEGIFYLKEIEAPNGYEILPDKQPLKIEFTNTKDEKAEIILLRTVQNKLLQYELPETGGSGIRFYTAAGTAMLISSFLLYEYSKKRAKKGGD